MMNWKYITLLIVGSSLLVQLPTYSLQFPPTGGTGAPARTASGGRRGDACVNAQAIPATALLPQNKLGTTVSETPTLFFYIPQTQAGAAEFVLMDNQGNELFQKTIAPNTSGIVKLDLPPTVKLEENKTYQWEFAIVCDAQDRSRDHFIQGTLQRIQLSSELKTNLEKAEPLERAKLYAEARIWHESLAIAAQLRETTPDAWTQLLNSVGLGGIASQPFISK